MASGCSPLDECRYCRHRRFDIPDRQIGLMMASFRFRRTKDNTK
jgi:hypothetical protein